jgi:hypothetical protein
MLNRKIIAVALFVALVVVVVGMVVMARHIGLAEPIMPPIGPP